MKQHWERLGLSIQGRWFPNMQAGRQSRYKGYVGELLHSLKNVWVEQFRLWGWETNPRRR